MGFNSVKEAHLKQGNPVLESLCSTKIVNSDVDIRIYFNARATGIDRQDLPLLL